MRRIHKTNLIYSSKEILEKYIFPRIAFEPNTGCWLWIGSVHPKGYAQVRIPENGFWKTKKVYRLCYEYFKDKIQNGLEPDHICRVPFCCNPDHLEPVTHQENCRRRYLSIRTHCSRGHEYIPENIYWKIRGKSKRRVCKKCLSIYAKKTREKKKLCLI